VSFGKNKMKKNIISIIFLAFGFLLVNLNGELVAAPVKAPAKQIAQKDVIVNTTSLNIVATPSKYLNKTVKMQATFDKFSTLGLDYSKALRKSSDYIGILIQRDDVVDHNIPLSEMKLFMKKEMAEKFIDLDTGDKIEITAKVFSAALNDPWLDIEKLTVIQKAKKVN
jgi:hypothetical protein